MSRRRSGRGSRSASRSDLKLLELEDTTSSESDDELLKNYREEEDEEEDQKERTIPESKSRPELLKPKIPFFLMHFNSPDEIPPPLIPYEPPPPYVQAILGMHEQDNITDVDQVYYTKWIGRSYMHCSYECKEDLEHCDGGPQALKKFTNMLNDYSLTQSPSEPNLSLFDLDDINSSWYQVERIIGHENDKFLVKWGNLPYDQCTWEVIEDLGQETNDKIHEYEERLKLFSYIKYPTEPKYDESMYTKVEEPLHDKNGNTLRDYQLEGLNWLRYCWYSHRNSILADEMGLGKTVQIVSTLVDISKTTGLRGPYLIIAPLSTLHHWQHEFENWSDLNAIVYHGSPLAKEIIQRYEIVRFKEDGLPDEDRMMAEVVITNYETLMSDYDVFKKVQWRYLVLDEGHRLKNHQGKCYKMLQEIDFKHCTLLTGTPIQNNVEELWSLLHFLHPKIFNDLAGFLNDFGQIDNAETLANLQQVIKPFLLRRKKNDVETTIAAKEETIIEVELTRIQKTFYRAFLDQNKDVLMSQISSGALPSLKNLMMELRKVCNHPYLIKDAAEKIEEDMRKSLPEGTPETEVQLKALVQSSGKLILLDKLLPKLRKDHHKVLIFSQMVKVLDLIEQYLSLIDIGCERIDGSVAENERQAAIERFGSDPDAFVFLLCTRAGGVGINLTAADTVIIYDSDWNPQNDIQAQSRCHRIGQTQKVKVYRLVTRGTYELEMLDRASKKLGLDHALLDSVEISNNPKLEAKEIEKLLRHGVYDIAKDDDSAIDNFCAADIDQILDSHSKELSAALNQTSTNFTKAKFDVEQDHLDLNAKDFWKQVLPNFKPKQETLAPRRCRKQSHLFDDSDGEDRRPKKQKQQQPQGVRQFIREITRHGYKGTPGQRCVLFTAAQNYTMDPADQEVLMRLLQVDSLENAPEEVQTLQRKYESQLKECFDKSGQIVTRALLFHNIGIVLTACQDDLPTWPTTGVDDDPQFEYALLYSIYKNGFIDHDKIFNGTGYRTEKSLVDRDMVKTMKQLVKALAPLAIGVETPDKDFLTPNEWKDSHEDLFNRTTLTDAEFCILFQLICAYGIPYNPDSTTTVTTSTGETKTTETSDDSIDFHDLYKISNFKCITYETVAESAQEIYDFAADKLSQAQNDAIIQRLGDYGNRIWIKKLRDNIRDIKRIRIFNAKMTDAEREIIPKMRTFENGPEWWGEVYEIALVKAIAKYGLVYVSVFLTDPEGPFLEKIPTQSRDQFKNAAEAELIRLKPVRPKDAGEFSVLYNDKQRLGRVIALLNFVDSRMERLARQAAGETGDSPVTYQPAITELPELPLDLSPQLTIVSFGHFKPGYESYPVGFISRRQYFSLNDPTEKTWYEASTRVEDGRFEYVVKMMEEPETTFVSHTPSGAWEALIQAIQKERGKRGLSKRKHTTVSGPFMYGFSHETVSACFQILREKDFA